LLTGCALTPKDPQAKLQSDVLLSRQLDAIDAYLTKTPPDRRTLIYVGSAQHSQSLVFQRDVLLMKEKLAEINPNVQSVLLSNQLESTQLVYPFATQSSLEKTFQKIGDWSQKYPINVVALISTHGNLDLLSVNIANTFWPAVRSVHLKKWLDGLQNVPTSLVFSACYSGSLIPELIGSQRVILTAAAHDRSSFGCAYHDKNTYFIGSLLGEGWSERNTWQDNYRLMTEKVLKMEQRLGLQPSSPQIYVSNDLQNTKVRDFVLGLPLK